MLSNAIQFMKFVWARFVCHNRCWPFVNVPRISVSVTSCVILRDRNNLLERLILHHATSKSLAPGDNAERLIYIISSERWEVELTDPRKWRVKCNQTTSLYKSSSLALGCHKNWHKKWISVSWSERGDNAATGDLLYAGVNGTPKKFVTKILIGASYC